MEKLIEKDKFRYNTNYIITYNSITDSDKSDTQYRCDFLKLFGFKQYDDDNVNEAQLKLFNKIKNNKSFNNIFEKVKKHKKYSWFVQGNTNFYAFIILFNYDLLYLLHNCLNDYFINHDISEDSYNAIFNALNN